MSRLINKIGFVETPIEIADLMVSLSTVNKKGLVLDTGCGRGVFLQSLKKFHYKNCIGIEIDPELSNLCKRKFSQFEIIQGDFLSYPFATKFDLIIGNPPYAHFNQLPSDIAKEVRRIVKTSESDIYYAFIIKSIELLKDGGELIYITPYHFFYNTYAKIVREYILKHGRLAIIIDLDEVNLFGEEHPETIIFKFKKGEKYDGRKKIKLLNITSRRASPSEIKNKALEAIKKRTSNELFEYKEIPHYTSSNPWSTFIEDVPNFPHILLKQIAKVGVGLVSGFDKAFMITEKEYQFLGDEEKKLVKELVKAINCKRFIVDGSVKYVIIDDSIINERVLQSKYPNIYSKLIKYKKQMKNRYLPKGKKWFHWQALRNYRFLLKHFNERRIYVPSLDRHSYNRFSLGKGGLLPSGDVLFIQPFSEDDLYFLLGYLNSTFFRKYYLSKGGRRGGRIAFTQRLLENVEIPLFSNEVKTKVISLVQKIILSLINGHNTTHLEKELDLLIYDAFHKKLFKDDIKYVLDDYLGKTA